MPERFFPWLMLLVCGPLYLAYSAAKKAVLAELLTAARAR
jgi:hypothetical protein